MTELYRDGDWQSVSEKAHPQAIAGDRQWHALRWIDGELHEHRKLDVVRQGPQDYEAGIRIRPPRGRTTFLAGKVWVRTDRYPTIPGDNGTRWIGPISLPQGEGALYIVHTSMDRKAGELGMGYGSAIRATTAVSVDQWMPKLDPRRHG